jgi:hypothetical protein
MALPPLRRMMNHPAVMITKMSQMTHDKMQEIGDIILP